MSSFLAGVRTLGSGFTTIARRPRLLLLGALPAVLSTLLLLGGVGTLLYFSGDLVTWMTPFAQDWSQALRTTLRVVLGVLVVGAAVLLLDLVHRGDLVRRRTVLRVHRGGSGRGAR